MKPQRSAPFRTDFGFAVSKSFAAGVLLALAAPAGATVLYSQNFNVNDSANWTTNDPALSDVLVDYFYDYSSIGVPAAPNGTGTRGLKMTANNSNGVFSGFSVSPTGQSFTGSYEVRFDLWSNYVGPLGPGGNGSTQLSTYGVGTSGIVAVWPGSATKESIMFAHTLDGGSAADYRAYSTAANTSYASGNAVYSAPGGGNNETNAYYTTQFPAVSAPAAQLTLFPGQTGTTNAGEASFRWIDVNLRYDGGFVTWTMNGLQIARVPLTDLTAGGGNIFFGHSDTNGGSSSDANDTLLNVTLIDNITVTQIPEAGSTLLLTLAAAAATAVRRRRFRSCP
jgi:hypothetical protein